MKKYLLRWPLWLLLVAITIAAIVPSLTFFHANRISIVHASGTPTITLSSKIVHFGDTITITTQGFSSGETVQLQLMDSSTDTWNLGTLSCDSNGTCTGSQAIQSGCAGGNYHLIAIGETSQLKASAPFTINPKIFVSSGSLPEGGPGAQITVEGDGFQDTESNVFIYWGTTQGIKEGLGSVEQCGNLFAQFNAPATVTPGSYPITVLRQKMNPAKLVATFHILQATITSTAAISPGQTVQIQLTGFLANEQVAVDWNANGGQQLSLSGVGYNGGTTFTITPPAASRGTYILTATGKQSGLKATSSLAIGPGIQISSVPSIPGSTVTISGGGFTAGHTVNVYFQKTSNGVVNATVDAKGNFTANLTLPSKYNPGLKYFVYAKSSTGSDQASTPVLFVTPVLKFFLTVNTYGQQVLLNGQGFAANESVRLYWNYKQVGQLLAATSTAGSDGTVSFFFTMPSDPNLQSVAIAAIGKTSGLAANLSMQENAAVLVNPLSGQPGTPLQINGGGFGSLEKVTVSFNGTTIANPTTNASGAFTAKYVVPSSTKTGVYSIAAQGSLSGVGVNTPFTVPPHVSISPTTGTTGTLITVTGTNCSPSGNITINWYDPNFGGLTYLTSVKASSKGNFKTTITAPANHTSGSIYLVEVFDPTGAIGQASFTAQ